MTRKGFIRRKTTNQPTKQTNKQTLKMLTIYSNFYGEHNAIKFNERNILFPFKTLYPVWFMWGEFEFWQGHCRESIIQIKKGSEENFLSRNYRTEKNLNGWRKYQSFINNDEGSI